ncbi:Pentatricopeptide repeat - like 10 [Theobroma cacao]|nr:Pentatricopeptide repeat - like 10 [Theobroma cacao]
MLTRRLKPLLKPLSNSHLRLIATESTHPQLTNHPNPPNPITPNNQSTLLKVCTILYQQQNSPDSRLHSSLSSSNPSINPEFFLQVCNTLPYSWRPIYRFFLYTRKLPHFTHNSLTFNKMLDVIGKSRNIELFWETCQEMGKLGLVNDKTFRIALKTLASARELKKCVEFFHLMNEFGVGCKLETLNKVVESLCKDKLVEEAKFVTFKLKEWVKPNGVTYKWLIWGFCDVGDLIEASKVWNLMVDEGLEPDVEAVETMMETFFKTNKFDEAMKAFQMMRVERMDDLGLSSYRLVIKWMCKRGKVEQANGVFEEMRQRGIQADNLTLASIIYGLLARGRIREAYRIAEGIEKPDISVYHALIKGLLRLRKASEATQVFREMINRGCEPIMHTYIMLLQGHLGKRGRKGHDPLVNFDTIFVGGLVKAGKTLEATKYVERTMKGGMEVPRFDYNKFLHYYSNEEGVAMFEEVGKKLREVGLFDLADILERYGQKMATRDKRRERYGQ